MRKAGLTKKYLGRYFDEAGDVARSLEYFRRAYVLDQKRAAAEPGTRSIQNDLDIDLGGIGEAQWRRGEYVDAIDSYRQSLEMRERLSARSRNAFARGGSPSITCWQNVLSTGSLRWRSGT